MKEEKNVCPKHGPMCVTTGRADPVIDPEKVWDSVAYCPDCLQEEQKERRREMKECVERALRLINRLISDCESRNEILTAATLTVLRADLDGVKNMLPLVKGAPETLEEGHPSGFEVMLDPYGGEKKKTEAKKEEEA